MIICEVVILALIACSVFGIVALTNFLTFEQSAYAVDDCDASSTCENTQMGTGNSQTNDCTNFSTCRNEINGNDNIQINRCDAVIECFNGVESGGNGNTQTNYCVDAGCASIAIGNRNTQNNDCTVDCSNAAFGDTNTVNNDCAGIPCASATFGDRNTLNNDCTAVTLVACTSAAEGPTHRSIFKSKEFMFKPVYL